MATTPTDRETLLARRLRYDIDTATYPAVNYQQFKGIFEQNPIIEPRIVDDETNDDRGWKREAGTGGEWRLEWKFKHSVNSDGTTINSVQAFLRARFLGAAASDIPGNEFGVRFYDDAGRTTGYEYEGRCYVKSWVRDKSSNGDTEEVSVVLQGQGAPTPITNPNGSLVPTVSSVVPVTGAAAGGGDPILIHGTHFTGATAVDFAATSAPDFVIVSDSTIAVVPPAHAAGLVQVKVTTPAGASANTAADDYTYV